jgi:hypothetical protein
VFWGNCCKQAAALIESCEHKGANYGGLILGCVEYARWLKHGFEIVPGIAPGSRWVPPLLFSGFRGPSVWGFFTEAIVPAMTHEDPHHYTFGEGSFLRRTACALSQVVRTKTDSGGTTFNFSEVLGNGMDAGLSNLYDPACREELENSPNRRRALTTGSVPG